MNDFNELLDRVAAHLSGKKVIVRLQAPAYQGFLGCAHKSASGKVILDVDPVIGDDDLFLKVFLHECAHALLHADAFLRSNISEKASHSLIDHDRPSKSGKDIEAQADALTDHWLEWCEKNCEKYCDPGMSELECKLNSLAYAPVREVK